MSKTIIFVPVDGSIADIYFSNVILLSLSCRRTWVDVFTFVVEIFWNTVDYSLAPSYFEQDKFSRGCLHWYYYLLDLFYWMTRRIDCLSENLEYIFCLQNLPKNFTHMYFLIKYSVDTIPSNYGMIYGTNIFIHINCCYWSIIKYIMISWYRTAIKTINTSKHPKKKIKRTKGSVQCYSNCIAEYKLILSGDIELNQSPGLRKQKCEICEKTVRSNKKKFTCEHCFEIIHSKCWNYLN